MEKKINKEYQEIKNLKKYYKLFPKKELKHTFKQIVDIRKFEINLYWKRATYFWTFNSVIFAGYILLLTSDTTNIEPNTIEQIQFLLICFGIIFSIAWYFVNRGSKYWQVNWEKHMVAMEERVIGSLYKTTIYQPYYQSRKQFFKLLAPFAFSVSKINHILNLFLIFIWISLLIKFLLKDFKSLVGKEYLFFCFIGSFTLFFVIVLIFKGRTGRLSKSTDKKNKQKNSDASSKNIKKLDYIKFQKRGFEEEE